jgi:murein DD-endopeptidase MepM/ murein hydrolase activator NlpD
MSPAPPKDKTHLEIQIHPGDIRRSVRYFFLTRSQWHYWLMGIVLFLAFIGTGAALAPGVVSNLLSYREFNSLSVKRVNQGKRLKSFLGRLEQIDRQTEDLRLRMSKVYLAYGLTIEESIGQGGFPFKAYGPSASIFSDSVRHGLTLQARIGEQLQVLDTFLKEVQSFEEAHRDQVTSTPSVCPLKGEDFLLTSPFGTRRSPFTKAIDFHAGIDLAAPTGTPIYAPADGLVVFAGRYPLRYSVSWWRYGNLVAVRHGDRFVSLFGHCDEVKVRRGQRVEQGELLAEVGNTGWSTSPHLHYEIRRRASEDGDFKPVDPRIYILDHRWRDEERLLVRARRAPEPKDYEPLPRVIRR